MGSSLAPAINVVIDALNAGHGINCVGTPDVVTPTKDSIIGRIASTSNKLTLSTKMAKDCFRQQDVLRNITEDAVDTIYGKGVLKAFPKGSKITNQDETGCSVYFILQGKVDVYVAGHLVATRCAKECVGEMSALDPTQRRSASLVAIEDVKILELDYDSFNFMLDENPKILKNLAVVLCNRLRERSKFFRTPNEKINFFIGSSSESLNDIKMFKETLNSIASERGVAIEINLWDEKVFTPSKSGLEALIAAAQHSDFAAFFLTPEDKIIVRGEDKLAPRDNVVFELGLFMGIVGRDRVYAFIPHQIGNSMQIPSDLNGITHVQYQKIEDVEASGVKNISYDFTSAIAKILDKIMDKGVRL